MRTHRRFAGGLAGLLGVVVTTTPALAQPPAGLVLEASGAIRPAVRPYTEILGDTSLVLGESGRVVFVHYLTCRTVTVVGGTVTITSGSYSTRHGKQTEARTPCPKKVNVRGGGELGGVVYRSVGANRGVTLQTEAAFVLSGRRASHFVLARITRDDAVVAEGPIRDQVFRWPADAAPLPAATAFELTLVPSRAQDRPVTIRFATPAIAAPAGQAPLIVIGVD